jgi:hypothetical protein
MKQGEFTKQLEQRLSENRRLVVGGMPEWLAPLNEILARHLWKGLLFISFGVTGGWFLLHPMGMLGAVRWILIMR